MTKNNPLVLDLMTTPYEQLAGILAGESHVYVAVTAAVGAGKTTVSCNLSCVSPDVNFFYIDKDYLSCLSECVYNAADIEVYSRSGSFFHESHVRDAEYYVLEQISLRALFGGSVITNSPYTSELKKEFAGEPNHLAELHRAVHERGGKFVIVFLKITEAECKRRLNKRLAEDPFAALRTPDIYADLDKFIKTQNLNVTKKQQLKIRNADYFLIWDTANAQESFRKLAACFGVTQKVRYDPEICKRPGFESLPPYLYTTELSTRP